MRFRSFIVQAASCLSVAYLTALTGYIYAWPSFTLENFTSNHTVLSHTMSSLEVGLLGSLTNIGALVTTPFCSWSLNMLGRKYSAILFGLPFVFAWAVVSLSNSVPVVLACVAVAGAGAAGQAISSVYIAEIAEDSIRGAFASMTVTGYYVGLLISYLMGGLLDYNHVVYANLTLSILYIILVSLLKESPVYLMQKGKEEEAKKALAFYRQVDVTSKEVEAEINHIKLQLDPRLQKMMEDEEATPEGMKAMELLLKNNPKANEIKQESEWRFLLNSKSSQRALATCLIIMTLTIMMGSVVMQVYAEPLFREAVPSINANKLSIFLAVDFIVASAVCSACVDRFGRKRMVTVLPHEHNLTIMMGSVVMQVYAEPLFREAVPSINANKLSIFLAVDFIVASAECSACVDRFGKSYPELGTFCDIHEKDLFHSAGANTAVFNLFYNLMTVTAAGSGVCTLLLGTQLRLHWAPQWCTALIIYLYSFVYNLGAAVVPFILPAEMFLPEVRGLCNSIIMACMWITNFVSLIIFNPLVESLGLGVVFCCFASTCFLGALYSHFFLPETKGLPADAIQLLFLKKKKIPVQA